MVNKRVASIKVSRSDKITDFFTYLLLTFFLLAVLYPLYFIIIASFSDYQSITVGEVWLWPKGFNVEGYKRIFSYARLWMGYKNTIFYTVTGTLINLILTLTAAYALSRKDFKATPYIMGMLVFTMFFGWGLIPTYILIRNLGMINTFWVMIIPNAVSVWNILITRTYFRTSIPDQLLDASLIDGCNNIKFFYKIVLPLSSAIIAVNIIFYAVGHWNAFFIALIYLNNDKLYPLQLILREILIMGETDAMITDSMEMMAFEEQVKFGEMIKYGVILVSSVPVLILYPFAQKYFVKGVMIGSIKG
jgi:putative aldouronate transport system permease protein